MAFARSGFGALGGQSLAGSLPALYVYTSTDAHTAIDASGYFNDLSDTLNVGDMLMVHGSTGGTRTSSLATHRALSISATAQPSGRFPTPTKRIAGSSRAPRIFNLGALWRRAIPSSLSVLTVLLCSGPRPFRRFRKGPTRRKSATVSMTTCSCSFSVNTRLASP